MNNTTMKNNDMKRFVCLVLCVIALISTVACGQETPTWQEQYDLGIRYLSEGNYEEAIIAFTAAIEIDPKRPEGYSGLANTYIAMGDYDSAAGVWESIPNENVGENTASFSTWQRKSEDIRTALENGESGIWIISCSFDKERFAAGEETEFQVVAFYSVPTGTEYSLHLEANVEDADSYTDIADPITVEGGKGVCQMTGSAVPTQWGRYFCLFAGMWGDGDDGYKDCIYLTPEGELSENFAPLNAYGATEFIYRHNYQPLEEFSVSDQQFIAALASAAINNDTDAAKALLGYELTGWSSSTIWNGYKIEIYSSGEDTTDDGDRSVSADIEMRSENGTGYIYRIHCINAVATKSEDSWSDGVFIERTVCPCTDWQWSGTMSWTYDWFHYQTWRDGSTVDSVEHRVLSGEMVNGWRNGNFTAERHDTAVWSNWPHNNEDTWYAGTAVYEDGVLVSVSGDDEIMHGDGNIGVEGKRINIEGASYEGTLDDLWVRDDLFW